RPSDQGPQVRMRERLPAGQVDLEDAQAGGLLEHAQPRSGRQLVLAPHQRQRVGAVQAVDRAAMGDLGEHGGRRSDVYAGSTHSTQLFETAWDCRPVWGRGRSSPYLGNAASTAFRKASRTSHLKLTASTARCWSSIVRQCSSTIASVWDASRGPWSTRRRKYSRPSGLTHG